MKPKILKNIGKNYPKVGVPPAVILCNPKYPRNVGAVIRACSCYGVKQLWYTGNRFKLDDSQRLPREERMRGYAEVEVFQYDYPFDLFEGAIPVAIEVRPGSEPLPTFEHQPNMVYVFGPEDGSISSTMLQHCHRFVSIPTRHCTNLSAAVYTVLYDRQAKLQPDLTLDGTLAEETRGFIDDPIFQMEEG
jgi:tRNA(Leu) C34 or U34 (ribose-2'-O)-methylase TrmL